MGYGIYVSANAKLDVFPNFVPPEVTVQTEAPGLSPEQVESLVTQPIENTINGLGSLESLRSESIPGLSVITVVFKEGTDIIVARQMLAEKLTETANQLPANVKTPQMSALTSATMDLLKIGLLSHKLSSMELRTFADWTVRPRLLSVPGVARCIDFWAAKFTQLQIQVRSDLRLQAYGLSISDVLAAGRVYATGVVGAGFIENANQRIPFIQTEGQSLTPEILWEIMRPNPDGQTVRLKDVAYVRNGVTPEIRRFTHPGRTGRIALHRQPIWREHGGSDAGRSKPRLSAEMQPLFDKEGITLYPHLHTGRRLSSKRRWRNIKLRCSWAASWSRWSCSSLGHFRTAAIS